MRNPKSKYYKIPNKSSAQSGSAEGGKIIPHIRSGQANPKVSSFGIWKLGFIW